MTNKHDYLSKASVLEAIDRNLLHYFKEANIAIRSDKEVALAAVNKDGNLLRYASAALRRDPEVVLAAVRNKMSAISSVDISLKNNREFIKDAVKIAPSLLFTPHIKREFHKDKEIVLTAVKNDGYLVQYADGSLLTDREIASAAVSNNGNALRFLPAFQNDRDLVLTAVKQSSGAILHASKELQTLAGNPTMTDTFNNKDIASKLQSAIEKEALQAKMAARGITFNQEGRGKDLGFAL